MSKRYWILNPNNDVMTPFKDIYEKEGITFSDYNPDEDNCWKRSVTSAA